MVHRDEVIAGEACGAVRAVLAADAAGDGSLSRDAVQLVADLVKRRKCVAPPQTVEVLLGLALRSARASDVKSGGAPQAALLQILRYKCAFGVFSHRTGPCRLAILPIEWDESSALCLWQCSRSSNTGKDTTPDAAQEVETEVSAACNSPKGTTDAVQPHSACGA